MNPVQKRILKSLAQDVLGLIFAMGVTLLVLVLVDRLQLPSK